MEGSIQINGSLIDSGKYRETLDCLGQRWDFPKNKGSMSFDNFPKPSS